MTWLRLCAALVLLAAVAYAGHIGHGHGHHDIGHHHHIGHHGGHHKGWGWGPKYHGWAEVSHWQNPWAYQYGLKESGKGWAKQVWVGQEFKGWHHG